MALLTIDPRNVPLEGRHLVGSLLAGEFFGLPPGDPIKPTGSVDYDLHAARDDDDLIVTGSLNARFVLECVRCLEAFDHLATLDPYKLEIPIENDQIIDLTEVIREDILLSLPSYPRCEDGNVSPRECSAEGRFDAGSHEPIAKPPSESSTGVWDALDELKS